MKGILRAISRIIICWLGSSLLFLAVRALTTPEAEPGATAGIFIGERMWLGGLIFAIFYEVNHYIASKKIGRLKYRPHPTKKVRDDAEYAIYMNMLAWPVICLGIMASHYTKLGTKFAERDFSANGPVAKAICAIGFDVFVGAFVTLFIEFLLMLALRDFFDSHLEYCKNYRRRNGDDWDGGLEEE